MVHNFSLQSGEGGRLRLYTVPNQHPSGDGPVAVVREAYTEQELSNIQVHSIDMKKAGMICLLYFTFSVMKLLEKDFFLKVLASLNQN